MLRDGRNIRKKSFEQEKTKEKKRKSERQNKEKGRMEEMVFWNAAGLRNKDKKF